MEFVMTKSKEQQNFDATEKELEKIKQELIEIAAKLKSEGKSSAHIDDVLNDVVPKIPKQVRDLLPKTNNTKNPSI
jgi:hypothetical protein